ncbi:hypothetical protein BAUCODRAFT_36852 [Baudoinia panamericana UAMH 10762]|uniref:Uncharacterized protein n=1 Tax=Baudoinia panamericana (strain UAMH 10762) TaxID=717646 RepID=M2M9S0_BAUPA|nr:uncharacterized protein BAUCODRAFT_36852 [Baudoinia panamericana UAMH 10762]EMC93186.1 hypothetical protein BAUCODRAFT_36852 [Baudoinia panamericana UAMH 10762]
MSSLFHAQHVDSAAFSWASIGLAVLTAIFQGLVAALAFMTESSSQWTFRFRLALVEHWWWTFVSVLLFVSLLMSTIAFTAGGGGDPVSVLALSSATFLAMVRYMLPAWQHRHYTKLRWYAWAGQSRTAVLINSAPLCGDARTWQRIISQVRPRLAELQPTASDYYGWALWTGSLQKNDPTDIIRVLEPNDFDTLELESNKPRVGIYASADPDTKTVSYLWGSSQGFLPRVSRAVSAMPLSLLKSSPTTSDGYDGRGLALAMGILGRNKGLQPWKLVFRQDSSISSLMENASTWTPRPAKVLRSFCKHTLQAQYGGLGEHYVNAAVELALLLSDLPPWAVEVWLTCGLEHQSLDINLFLAETALQGATDLVRKATLTAHYECSYVSMILSLNAMNPAMRHRQNSGIVKLLRPDLTCTEMLMRARGQDTSTWWDRKDTQALVQREISALSTDVDWKAQAARLLGPDVP